MSRNTITVFCTVFLAVVLIAGPAMAGDWPFSINPPTIPPSGIDIFPTPDPDVDVCPDCPIPGGCRWGSRWLLETTHPVAKFSADPIYGTAPLTVQFTDKSTGYPGTWLWDFGDGSTSTQRNPSHTYQYAGAYDVVLTVTKTRVGTTVTSTHEENGYITVIGTPAPQPTREPPDFGPVDINQINQRNSNISDILNRFSRFSS